MGESHTKGSISIIIFADSMQSKFPAQEHPKRDNWHWLKYSFDSTTSTWSSKQRRSTKWR